MLLSGRSPGPVCVWRSTLCIFVGDLSTCTCIPTWEGSLIPNFVPVKMPLNDLRREGSLFRAPSPRHAVCPLQTRLPSHVLAAHLASYATANPKAAFRRPPVALLGNDNTERQRDPGGPFIRWLLLYYRPQECDLLSLLVTVGRKSPRGWARCALRSEVELEGLGHVLLPGLQAGQRGGDAHDVPGLLVRHHGGLVGQQLHACVRQEPWEEEAPGWYGRAGQRSEGLGVL